MGYDKFAIVPLQSGLENNVKPFLIPDDAYEQLDNVYLWRARLRKRFGAKLMNTTVPTNIQPLFSRLRLQIGAVGFPAVTDVNGNLAFTRIPGNFLNPGSMFSVGTAQFIVTTVPSVIGNALTLTTATLGTVRLNSTVPNVYQFRITGNDPALALLPVYWYPSLPVMGLPNFEQPNTQYEAVFGFDTEFAYQFINGAWQQLGSAIWSGTDSQFFWTENYRGLNTSDYLLYVTNNNAPDQIRYWDGLNWNSTTPILNANGDTLQTCKIIVSFQDRLLFLAPQIKIGGIGNAIPFTNQVNWSVIGDPTTVNAFNVEIPGQGGFAPAPTKEDITTAQILRNRLMVTFETQTWELAFTGNQVRPFVWQSINTELGSDSTFSHVPFDRFILSIGNQGVQSYNGVNVQRIDDKIPTEVINIQNANQGFSRVYVIRDYNFELVYWTMPLFENNPVYPDKVLVYNYKTGTWAFNDDSITCFGYFQQQPNDTWASDTGTWKDDDSIWSSGFNQSNTTDVLAGNQEGFTFIIDGDLNSNSPSLQITNIIASATPGLATFTVYNHNLQNGDYVQVLNAIGITNYNGKIYLVTVVNSNTITLLLDAPDIPVVGVYTGGGTLSRVSVINILTKQYNFYMKEARNCFVARVDFLVDATVSGEITVDTYVSSAGGLSLINQGQATGSLVGTGVLETSPYVLRPLEASQDRYWHPMYLQAEGECVQLNLYMSDEQIRDVDIATSDFQLNGMVFWTLKTSTGFTSG